MKGFWNKIGIFVCFGMVLSGNFSCKKNTIPDLDFRQEMRNFIQNLSAYSRNLSPAFIVIPQNGQELVTLNGEASGPLAASYLQSIDGQAREDLIYGYTGDGILTPPEDRQYMEGFLDRIREEGKRILVTDYCSQHPDMLYSYLQNEAKGYISFASDHRELDHIPAYPNPVFRENINPVHTLGEAQNLLLLLNPATFSSKNQFLDSLQSTNYDILVIDLFFDGTAPLSSYEVESLKAKATGERRLVICYLSIGEAENYRYYWQPGWEIANPVWLDKPNPDWPGNFRVRYWDPAWQSIIFGNDTSYLKRIIDAGFDGVYLDIVDAYEYFEE